MVDGHRGTSPNISGPVLREPRLQAPNHTVSGPAVVKLTLTRFRNYPHLRLITGPEPVVLTGANGSGKSNLLEAISFLAPGRGLRGARLAEIDHHEHDSKTKDSGGEDSSQETGNGLGWGVAAELITPSGPVEIGTGVEAGETRKRVVKIDGQTARGQTALAGRVPMVWLTPKMDRLFTEGAAERRRFLDRLVFGFDTAHAGRLVHFERAMRERSRLLRSGGADDGWLRGLEDTMATSAVAVAAARLELVGRLRAACTQTTGPFPRAEPSVVGPVEQALVGRPALVVEDDLRAQLRASRRSDAESGGAALGPHRSDLVVRFQAPGRPGPRLIAAEQSSTGEQKALLLALILANARLLAAAAGAGAPLLLLDEVAAHLDPERRAALFEQILALGGQAWLTGTDAGLFAPLAGRVRCLHIKAATITEA
ncbi:DNA replication and repair protein RecF [uncultured Gammaproteobacteria bacterium]